MFYSKTHCHPPSCLPFSDNHAAFEEQSRSPSSSYSPAQCLPGHRPPPPRSVPQRAEMFTIASIRQLKVISPPRTATSDSDDIHQVETLTVHVRLSINNQLSHLRLRHPSPGNSTPISIVVPATHPVRFSLQHITGYQPLLTLL
ncbi:hypothetical protein B0H19DRAFT_1080383 [Mycena capillaripes]|nr:hypothetical protein B0H19DRAFT_1080383 [Mycena capillaripes]